MKPKVSIILPVRNAGNTLRSCLDSLINLIFPKDDLEIVVVDNNSTDNTKTILKPYPVKYVFESQIGRGSARNRGVIESLGELAVFTDADCLADRYWLLNIIKGFSNKEIGGCGGKILIQEPKNLIEKYIDYLDVYSQEENILNKKIFLPCILTANAAYPRRVLEEVGLFDEQLNGTEDIDLSWRVYLKGYKLAYTPEAIIYHLRHRSNPVNSLRKCFQQGEASFCLQRKYINIVKIPFFSCVNGDNFFIRQFKSLRDLPASLFKGKGALAKILPFFDILKNTAFVLGKISVKLRPKWKPVPISGLARLAALRQFLLRQDCD